MTSLLIAVIFVLAAIGLSTGSYSLARWWSRSGAKGASPSQELAGGVLSQIAALHGLILALVFAQELVNYEQLKGEMAKEANAIADVYFDAERFGGESAAKIKDQLFVYVQTVIDEEWKHLGETGQLSGKAWSQWDSAYNMALDLQADSPRQESLRSHMLDQIHGIAAARDERQNHEVNSVNVMFWLAAIIGLILIAAAYHHHPPNRSNLAFLGMLGGYTGLIIFFIYAFSNPFSEPASLDPHAFRLVAAQLAAARGS